MAAVNDNRRGARWLVRGGRIGKYCILQTKSAVIPNAVAALLIHLERTNRKIPLGYWTEGNPRVQSAAARQTRLTEPWRE
jgi:hypothetical protein